MDDGAPSRVLRREYLWLALIVVAALVLRAFLASLPRVIRWDEPDYLRIGWNWLTGRGYAVDGMPEMHYTPLFPLLAGSIYVATGDPELASAFWYVLLGALAVIPIYLIARRIYGRPVALISGLLAAFFPGLGSSVLYWGTMTEPVFIFCLLMAEWILLIALEGRKLWAYGLAGALVSLAYLTRPEGLVWAGALALACVVIWALRRELFRWRSLLSLVVYLFAFLLVAAPYGWFLYRQTGQIMATGKLAITYDIGRAVLERDPVLYDQVTASLDSETGEILWWSQRRFERSILDLFLEDPRAFLARIGQNASRLWGVLFSANILPLFFVVPIVLGWFSQPWPRGRLAREAFLWLSVLPVFAFLPFHIEVRFFSPLFPLAMVWIASGLWQMGAWVDETLGHWRRRARSQGTGGRRSAGRWQWVTVLVLAVVVLGYWARVHIRVVRGGQETLDYAHKQAGLWLGEHTSEDAKIMSRDLAISIYAERGFVPSPRADYAALLDYARRKGADYLVVDEHELRVLRPHLAFLLDIDKPPPELKPLRSWVERGGRTIVYRIES